MKKLSNFSDFLKSEPTFESNGKKPTVSNEVVIIPKHVDAITEADFNVNFGQKLFSAAAWVQHILDKNHYKNLMDKFVAINKEVESKIFKKSAKKVGESKDDEVTVDVIYSIQTSEVAQRIVNGECDINYDLELVISGEEAEVRIDDIKFYHKDENTFSYDIKLIGTREELEKVTNTGIFDTVNYN